MPLRFPAKRERFENCKIAIWNEIRFYGFWARKLFTIVQRFRLNDVSFWVCRDRRHQACVNCVIVDDFGIRMKSNGPTWTLCLLYTTLPLPEREQKKGQNKFPYLAHHQPISRWTRLRKLRQKCPRHATLCSFYRVFIVGSLLTHVSFLYTHERQFDNKNRMRRAREHLPHNGQREVMKKSNSLQSFSCVPCVCVHC